MTTRTCMPLFGVIFLLVFCYEVCVITRFTAEDMLASDELKLSAVENSAAEYLQRMESSRDTKSINCTSNRSSSVSNSNSISTSNIIPHTQPVEDSNVPNQIELENWYKKIQSKLFCFRGGVGAAFFYHSRKAAGTTIREWLSAVCRAYHVQYYETEGITLNQHLLSTEGLLTVTTLRHPIDRILSLYWYEHVEWWKNIKHDMTRCRSLSDWVDGWRDGSRWKSNFVNKNRGTVYVEVENYYTKSLIGWQGGSLSRADLALAKQRLTEFDIVFITDFIGSVESFNFLDHFFGSGVDDSSIVRRNNARLGVLKKKINRGNSESVEMESTLAADKVDIVNFLCMLTYTYMKDAVIELLKKINSFDMELWTFAVALAKKRQSFVIDTQERHNLSNVKLSGCQDKTRPLSPDISHSIGLFRPVGHKGP